MALLSNLSLGEAIIVFLLLALRLMGTGWRRSG